MPSASATSFDFCPSTAVRQNACQVGSRNSGRTLSAAHRNSCRRYSASNRAVAPSSGAGCSSRRRADVGVAAAARVAAPVGHEVDDQVAGDLEQPAAERAPVGVGLPAVDRRGDGAEDVLGQVVGVGVLETALPGQAADQRGVDLQEFGPRPPVLGVAEAGQKARPCRRRVAHASSSRGKHKPRPKTLHGFSHTLSRTAPSPRVRSALRAASPRIGFGFAVRSRGTPPPSPEPAVGFPLRRSLITSRRCTADRDDDRQHGAHRLRNHRPIARRIGPRHDRFRRAVRLDQGTAGEAGSPLHRVPVGGGPGMASDNVPVAADRGPFDLFLKARPRRSHSVSAMPSPSCAGRLAAEPRPGSGRAVENLGTPSAR